MSDGCGANNGRQEYTRLFISSVFTRLRTIYTKCWGYFTGFTLSRKEVRFRLVVSRWSQLDLTNKGIVAVAAAETQL